MEVTHIAQNPNSRYATIVLVRAKVIGVASAELRLAMAPARVLIPLVSGTSLVFLALLDGLAVRAGGAAVMLGRMRVTFCGALAMALTAAVGSLFGADTRAGPNGC
jgi:hypothetical protein